MKNESPRVVVVGPSWYGNWVEYFYEALTGIGVDAEVVYTNTLLGSSVGYSSERAMRTLEKCKRMVLKASPKLFEVLKDARRALSELDLFRLLRGKRDARKTFVVFVWTPPSVRLLKRLRALPNTRLIYWIGEPLNRNEQWRKTLGYFDHLFLVDSPEWIGGLDEASLKKATLLPLSSTPKVFYPIEMSDSEQSEYACDVAFVGLYRRERAEMIEPIKRYNFKIYGFGWEGAEKEFPWLAGKIFGPASTEELNRIFNGAKISVGSLGISFAKDLPTLTQRVFDIALAGGFQLSQWNPLTEQVFGESVPLFRSTDELAQLLEYYLAHPGEREQLAGAARKIALENTWEDRAREALRVFLAMD